MQQPMTIEDLLTHAKECIHPGRGLVFALLYIGEQVGRVAGVLSAINSTLDELDSTIRDKRRKAA